MSKCLVKRVTITLPDELHVELQKHRHRFNISLICQKAIKEQLKRYNGFNSGWIITYDHIEKCEMSIMGPSNLSICVVNELKDGNGKSFRMYRRDGELCLEGRCIYENDLVSYSPLSNFGVHKYGCTKIRYATGKRKISVPVFDSMLAETR